MRKAVGIFLALAILAACGRTPREPEVLLHSPRAPVGIPMDPPNTDRWTIAVQPEAYDADISRFLFDWFDRSGRQDALIRKLEPDYEKRVFYLELASMVTTEDRRAIFERLRTSQLIVRVSDTK